MTRMRGALVGAFVLGGLLLFGGGLFLIGDRRLMFTDQFEIWSSFGKVTGLQVGTRVRLAGLDAGEVLEVRLPSRPSERFRVRMRLREDVRQLVRADSTCAVQTDGLVGNAFLQVSVGTDDAAPIQPGDTIDGIDPVDIADLIQEGRGTFRTVTAQMVTLREDVSDVIASLTDTIRTTDEMIGTVGGDVRTMTAASVRFVEDLQAAAGEARDLVGDVRRGEGTIGQLLTDRTLYEQLTRIGGEAEQTARNVQETSDRVRQAVEVFAGSDGTAAQITQTLRNTLAEVQEVTSDLAEGTEALKRNFLFRGFFRDRGFFDLDTVSQEAYQAGVLEGADRTALRIWIDGAALFASNADGTLRLTPEGQRRLNSAMADLVRYPRDSPLVIEGYAAVNEGDAPYLLSSDRATLVRDYILGRFRRQATMTGIMPLGSTAAGSPGGDGRWSGVALALFVRNDALGGGPAAQARRAP